jgi:hypothetical protein
MPGTTDPMPSTTDRPRVILTRPAPGSVQTIQLTSKRWKALMLVAFIMVVAGASAGGILLAREPRLLTHPTWLMVIAAALFIAGLVLLVMARVGAWWDHG